MVKLLTGTRKEVRKKYDREYHTMPDPLKMGDGGKGWSSIPESILRRMPALVLRQLRLDFWQLIVVRQMRDSDPEHIVTSVPGISGKELTRVGRSMCRKYKIPPSRVFIQTLLPFSFSAKGVEAPVYVIAYDCEDARQVFREEVEDSSLHSASAEGWSCAPLDLLDTYKQETWESYVFHHGRGLVE